MGAPLRLLAQPSNGSLGAWFEAIATLLLQRCALRIAGEPHRIIELELYYHSVEHPDPFVHQDARQARVGRWYFHRRGGHYTGGSYKGLDLTFGPEGIIGGVLIRTLKTPQGQLIHGCSLCVDHILSKTGFEHVRQLDEALGEAPIWSESPYVQVDEVSQPSGELAHMLYSSARVGLTLKRAESFELMPDYIMRPYRFFSEPSLPKGKLHTIIALYKQGADTSHIHALTRSPVKTIERYIKAFERGRSRGQLGLYMGRALKPDELCELHGLWHRGFEQEAPWNT